MKRQVFLVLLCFCCMWSNSQSQVLLVPQSDTTQPEVPEPTKVELMVMHAKAAPDPLLRYHFWPLADQRRDENAMPLVSRALMLSLQVSDEAKAKFSERYGTLMETPLKDFPQAEVRDLLSAYSAALGEMKRTENLMGLDYGLQLDELSFSETLGTLLPEVQELRQLARLVALRARLAMSEGRWDDFVDDCRLGFRIAEVAGGSTDFLISRLVSLAISGMIMENIAEAIQQPECPNLYWALAVLPEHQLFDTRDAIEYESVIYSRLLASADPLGDQTIGAESARARIKEIVGSVLEISGIEPLFGSDSPPDNQTASQLLAGLYTIVCTEPARDFLADSSSWKGRVSELSSSEAVLRAAKMKAQGWRDHWIAWSMIPPDAWKEYESERNSRLRSAKAVFDPMEFVLPSLNPDVSAAHAAGQRVRQQRNLLLTLEAIRMNAAAKNGLPQTLKNLRPVPTWNDAITSTSFGYQRTSATTATLERAKRWKSDKETKIQIELKVKP